MRYEMTIYCRLLGETHWLGFSRGEGPGPGTGRLTAQMALSGSIDAMCYINVTEALYSPIRPSE